MRRSLLILALGVSAGCSEASPTAVRADELTGSWQTPRQTLSPSGSYQTTLTFAADGGVTYEVRNYGLYPGQRADDLASYSRTYSRYETAGDTVILHPARVVTWDKFYGAQSPERVEEIHDGSVRWNVVVYGDQLMVNYTTYPADAPVLTTVVYRRVR
jgi:hypothetical protein